MEREIDRMIMESGDKWVGGRKSYSFGRVHVRLLRYYGITCDLGDWEVPWVRDTDLVVIHIQFLTLRDRIEGDCKQTVKET